MLIIVLLLYGFTFYFSAIAYAMVTNAVSVSYVVQSGPLIVAGFIAAIAAADFLLCSLAERVRASLHARRAGREGGAE